MDEIAALISTADEGERKVLNRFVSGLVDILGSADLTHPDAKPERCYTQPVTLASRDDLRPSSILEYRLDRPNTTDNTRAEALRRGISSRDDLMGIPSKQPFKPTESTQKEYVRKFLERILQLDEEGAELKNGGSDQQVWKGATNGRPMSKAQQIREQTFERLQSRQDERIPKFEETLRKPTLKELNAAMDPNTDADMISRKRMLISSLVEKMSGTDLDKLERIISSDGMRPPMKDMYPTSRHHQPAAQARKKHEQIHPGSSFQPVTRSHTGHFVINTQFVSERTEPINQIRGPMTLGAGAIQY